MTEENCRFCGTKMALMTEGGKQTFQICVGCGCIFYLGDHVGRQEKCFKCGKHAFKVISLPENRFLFVHNARVTATGIQYEGCTFDMGADHFV